MVLQKIIPFKEILDSTNKIGFFKKIVSVSAFFQPL